MNFTDLDEFTQAYITAALWSTNDESDETGGDPLDANYDWDDIAPETLETIIADCKKFQEENADDIATGNIGDECSDAAYAGHDFWLTRNGHGVGFWDGDWQEEPAKRLTKACDTFGEVYLFVQDGKIHGE